MSTKSFSTFCPLNNIINAKVLGTVLYYYYQHWTEEGGLIQWIFRIYRQHGVKIRCLQDYVSLRGGLSVELFPHLMGGLIGGLSHQWNFNFQGLIELITDNCTVKLQKLAFTLVHQNVWSSFSHFLSWKGSEVGYSENLFSCILLFSYFFNHPTKRICIYFLFLFFMF